MGGIVAAVGKKGVNVVPKVLVMLEMLKHRGVDAHGVATPKKRVVAKTTEELATESICSSVALGHNLSRILRKDQPQPVLGNGFSLVFEALFKDMRGSEDFIEDLDHRFKLRKKLVFYVLGEVKREAFLSNPATAEAIVMGKDAAHK